MKHIVKAALAAVAAATLPLLAAAQAAAPALPTAPVRNVPEVFFGTTVDDPYRDFEDKNAPAVAAWMKAHSDHAHAVLKAIPGRNALRAAIERYDSAAAARVNNVTRLKGDLYFYERRGATEDQFKLYMRRGLKGAEKLLFDPEALKAKTGKPHAINYYLPSPDGSKVAVGVSASGSEDAAMRVLDTRTGQQIGPEISRVQWGATGWSPDGRELYFHRMQELAAGAPPTDKYQKSFAAVMLPGGPESSIKPLVTAGADLGIPATEFPAIEVLPDGRVLLVVIDGVSPDFAAWHTTLKALRAGKPDWKKLVGREDQVSSLSLKGDRVWAITSKGAPRFKLLAGRIDGFSPATAQVLVPESARVISGAAAAADALYVEAREGNIKKLFKIAHGDAKGTLREVPLPVAGAFTLTGSGVKPDQPGALFVLQGWTRARQYVQVGADGKVTNTGLQPAGPHDAPEGVVATEVQVKSHDGVMVPMSIIHKQGTKLDGNNPTLLYGYASYGITEEPFYSTSRLAWLDAGGVYAIANPRGSGVFGRQWHDDGKQATKPNTWRDFIACAEWLIANNWTKPARLSILGGSAGGILVGRAMTERPDLFAAVVPAVGSMDMVRAETTANGVPNIPEFGSRKTEAGFRALLAMSTYHQIKDGTKYPAVLLTHGVNDPRVEVWNTTKVAARLMAATTSGKPVLMRLDYDAGHGIGDTKAQAFDERADMFAFLLWQMGVEGYQPAR
jgi:prolyl oligopeptidase